jgi:DNA helicase HerA-like ATPase
LNNAEQFRDQDHPSTSPKQFVGRVLSVHGSQATVGLRTPGLNEPNDMRATVGKLLGIRTGKALLVGMITDVSIQTLPIAREQGYHVTANLDLMGEIKEDDTRTARFQRGVTTYPAIGDTAIEVGSRELRLVYNISGSNTVDIGHLQQDSTIGAYVNIDEMLSKHFAVLGTTGVGKSSGVAVILRQILQARPDLRIFLLDGHNEYGRCFGDQAQTLNPANLKLPFWLFNFEEIVDVIFGGRPGVEEEIEILAEVIPLAKGMYQQYRGSADRQIVRKTDPGITGYTADTPVPYRVADLLALIDERMGKLENRSSRMKFNKLITRIETVRNDPRYAFMFENANVGGDTMAEVLSELFRLPANGRPMTIMQLAGFPTEVVDSVVSVLCRMAFDFGLWSDGAVPLLFVCEEAHRYASADRSIGFGPTRRALSRIAKEGRKYGVYLAIVSQRPAELDPTIISQCSTLFAMRMANDRDQALLKSAVSDVAANLLAFVPTLGTREVLAFGQGVAVPTRLKFSDLPEHQLPKSEAVRHANAARGVNQGFMDVVIERWRGATMSRKQFAEEPIPDIEQTNEALLLRDPERFKSLRKPLDAADAPLAPRREPAAQPADALAAPRRETFGQQPNGGAEAVASLRKDSLGQLSKWRRQNST